MGAKRSDWSLAYAIGSRPEWEDKAACYPEVAEYFWPLATGGLSGTVLSQENKLALKLCASCPVRRECLQRELDNPQPWIRIAGGRVLDANGVVL